MNKMLLVFAFASQFAAHLAGQEKPVETIFRCIYNMEYNKADSLLVFHRTEIDPYYLAVLEIDKSYWENVTGSDEPDYNAFEKTLKNQETHIDQGLQQQAIRLITFSYQLRYEIKRLHFFDAAFTRKKTMDLFKELKNRSNELSAEQQQLFVLYNALIMYFDNFLKPFFISSKRQNMKQTLADMERMANAENTVVKTLAAYFAGRTWLKFERNPVRAERHFSFLNENYPGNKKFAEYLADCRERKE